MGNVAAEIPLLGPPVLRRSPCRRCWGVLSFRYPRRASGPTGVRRVLRLNGSPKSNRWGAFVGHQDRPSRVAGILLVPAGATKPAWILHPDPSTAPDGRRASLRTVLAELSLLMRSNLHVRLIHEGLADQIDVLQQEASKRPAMGRHLVDVGTLPPRKPRWLSGRI